MNYNTTLNGLRILARKDNNKFGFKQESLNKNKHLNMQKLLTRKDNKDDSKKPLSLWKKATNV